RIVTTGEAIPASVALELACPKAASNCVPDNPVFNTVTGCPLKKVDVGKPLNITVDPAISAFAHVNVATPVVMLHAVMDSGASGTEPCTGPVNIGADAVERFPVTVR